MRRTRHVAPEPERDDDPEDDPGALRRRVTEVHRLINRDAGRLPGAAVVGARWLLDTLREVIDTSEALDVHSTLFIRGVLDDYLPTTVRTYLALGTPLPEQTAALLDQIGTLRRSAAKEQAAATARRTQEFAIQSHFLHSKFTGSDLDLP